jgi:hypothetical protein
MGRQEVYEKNFRETSYEDIKGGRRASDFTDTENGVPRSLN